MNVAPFTATVNGITVAVTSTASAGVALPTGTGSVVRIVNEGPNIAFVDFASTAAGAVATLPTTGTGASSCLAVLAGEDVLFTRSTSDDLFISAICRAGASATLSVYVGEGSQ